MTLKIKRVHVIVLKICKGGDNMRSKLGFTLIELLVVIGILAVLLVIGIPSVAGLIDRANVSADATNANEMTNAIERFASEYELFKQDVANGTIDFGNMDAVQSRVYDVIKCYKKKDVASIEFGINDIESVSGCGLDKNSKYPLDATTVALIMDNYIKGDTKTFDPKQSDNSYYYSPNCGTIICAKTGLDTPALNAYVKDGVDANGCPLDENTVWINLTEAEIAVDHSCSHMFIKDIDYVCQICKTKAIPYTFSPADYDAKTGETTATDTFVVIPEWFEYRGKIYIVTAIKSYAFMNSSIEGVVLPDSLEKIEGQAFYACKSLKSISFPDNLTKIEGGAFGACTSLSGTIVLPSKVTSVSSGLFANCSSLYGIRFNGKVDKIGSAAFQGCTNLQSVVLPNSLKTIERNAFYGCSSLSNIALPKSLTSIGTYAFYCSGLTSIVIPDTVTEIPNASFRHCAKLDNVVIGSGVTTIEPYAFQASKLGSITFKNPNNWTVDEKAVEFSNDAKQNASLMKQHWYDTILRK